MYTEFHVISWVVMKVSLEINDPITKLVDDISNMGFTLKNYTVPGVEKCQRKQMSISLTNSLKP